MIERVLTLSNEEIRRMAAAKMDRQGKSTGCYQEDSTGACCMMGAVRLVMFGRVDTWNFPADEPRMTKYNSVIQDIANALPPDFQPTYDGHIRIGKFNDMNSKETVVRVLAGKAAE